MRAQSCTAIVIGIGIFITGCDALNKSDQKGSPNKCTAMPLLSTPPEEQQTLLEANVPFQKFPELGAKKIGLLFTSGVSSWGATYNHARQLAEASDDQKMYRFSTDSSSPFVLYFKSAGEGFNYIPDWQVPISANDHVNYNAAQFAHDTVNTFGLKLIAHLVELIPNDGKGNSGVHFVATDVKVLDGTDGYALSPSNIMTRTNQAFQKFVHEQSAEVAEKMAAAQDRDNPETIKTAEKREHGMFPTWISQDNVLQLVMVYREIQTFSKTSEEQLPECPDGAPCMGPQTITTETSYGVELVGTYKFGADGEAIGEPIFSEPTIILAGQAAAGSTTTANGPVSDDFEDGDDDQGMGMPPPECR